MFLGIDKCRLVCGSKGCNWRTKSVRPEVFKGLREPIHILDYELYLMCEDVQAKQIQTLLKVSKKHVHNFRLRFQRLLASGKNISYLPKLGGRDGSPVQVDGKDVRISDI